MSNAHEHRLLVLTDADGCVHNSVVEAVAGSTPLEQCDILTQWDICARLAGADPACLEHIAEVVRNGNYPTILLIVHKETEDRAGCVAEAARVLTDRLAHADVRGMVLHGETLAAVHC